jgi:hypothetical protein
MAWGNRGGEQPRIKKRRVARRLTRGGANFESDSDDELPFIQPTKRQLVHKLKNKATQEPMDTAPSAAISVGTDPSYPVSYHIYIYILFHILIVTHIS